MITIVTTIASMSSAHTDKPERLLNLTLALLGTKKPLSKQQIFEKIAGYSGTPDGMERMFERDKDELRQLGVFIDVLPIDPFFEDELGYQIVPQNFFLPETLFSAEETLWLSIAANLVRDTNKFIQAQTGLQKLLGQASVDLEEIIETTDSLRFDLPRELPFDLIWKSIHDKKVVAFSYNTGTEEKRRFVSPYALISRNGIWYLLAKDHKDSRIKTFRVDRMALLEQVDNAFLPQDVDFNLQDYISEFRGDRLPKVSARVRAELSSDHPLVKLATRSSHAEQILPGELLTFENVDRIEIKERVLWAGEKIEILEPIELRNEIVDALREVVRKHL